MFRLEADEPELHEKERKLQSMSHRRSSSGDLELRLKQREDKVQELREQLDGLTTSGRERETLMEQRKKLSDESCMLSGKAQDIKNRYGWLNFNVRPLPNFNPNDVIGVFANLIRPKKPEYAVALEIALGGIVSFKFRINFYPFVSVAKCCGEKS